MCIGLIVNLSKIGLGLLTLFFDTFSLGTSRVSKFIFINIIMFKIIVLGNSAVGKTSIVTRFVGDRFDPGHKATISADFQMKHLNLQGNDIRL